MLSTATSGQLQPQASGDTFWRHRGPVTCAAPVPASSRIITSGYDGAVGLFDAVSGQVELMGYHAHLVNRVVVNPAGTLAASCSSDFNIILWDLISGQPLNTLRGHADDVEDFVFINHEYGASVSRDWRVLLWNLRTGSIEHIFLGHAQDVLSISYLDGRLYTSGDDMTLRAWDLKTRSLINTLGPFDTEADTCAIDALHRRIVLGCDDGIVRIFDIDSGELLDSIQAHQAGIKKVACATQNGDILSAAYDQQVLVWDAQSRQLKQRLEHRPTTWERSFNWSADGRSIVAGTFDGTVIEWDVQSGRCRQELGLIEDGVALPVADIGNACFNDIALLNDQQIAVVSDDGLIRSGRLSVANAEWTHVHKPASGRVLANAITSAPQSGAAAAIAQEIVTGTHGQSLQRYQHTPSGLQQTLSVNLEQGPINCVRIAGHADYAGEYFVACYTGAILRMGRDGQVLDTLRVHDNAVKALVLHPHLPIGVSCSAEGVLASWRFDGELIQTYPGHLAIIDDVDLSPDGSLIASAGRDFTLKIHDRESGALVHNIGLGRRSPKALRFVDNHTVIVTNYWGELLKVDLHTGDVLRRRIAENGISSLALRDDQILACSYDGAVYLVSLSDLQPLNELREMTQRINSPAFQL
ncbi:MAG: WD40 repeat domain-containing protein [Wenzhouxiangellaceae bacterium]